MKKIMGIVRKLSLWVVITAGVGVLVQWGIMPQIGYSSPPSPCQVKITNASSERVTNLSGSANYSTSNVGGPVNFSNITLEPGQSHTMNAEGTGGASTIKLTSASFSYNKGNDRFSVNISCNSNGDGTQMSGNCRLARIARSGQLAYIDITNCY